jgi:molybdopterin molybdotransferase
VRSGDTVLGPGRVLRPGEIGVLAMLGYGHAPVFRRPRVGILATGDELVDIDGFEEVRAGRRIVNSNSYALAAAVHAVGGEPVQLGIAKDDVDDVLSRIRHADRLDALLTTAGASVGEHDLVKDALERAGMRTLFWRVRMRPGSPFSFGVIPRAGSTGLPVFGLPGNPVSAVVTFEVLGKPALRRMTGRTDVHAVTRTVRIGERIRSKAGRARFLRVRLERDDDDGWSARLTGAQGSGMLTSVARADALLVVPLDASGYEEGESAVAIVLDPPDAAAATPGF